MGKIIKEEHAIKKGTEGRGEGKSYDKKVGCSTWVDPNYTLLKIKQTTLVYLNLTNFFKKKF